MELRITLNKSSEQFTGICRNQFCYLQDGIQDKFPYLVRNGQLESIIGSLGKDGTNGFIRFKSLYRAKYVVLHQGQCKTGNLCREVHRLAFAHFKQTFTVMICDFRSPAHGVNSICLKEVKAQVCSEQSIPLPLRPRLQKKSLTVVSAYFTSRVQKVHLRVALCLQSPSLCSFLMISFAVRLP